MVCVDAGAIPETLFESEFFGHVKGAFTDAHTDHVGKFEQANGGTLFLDEIGNIPLHLQAKLLRAIQNRNITKVGDNKLIPIDIRLICATNMNLEQMVKDGHFREDLYYRINIMTLHLPPLRERIDEIYSLSMIFLERFAQQYHRNVKGLSDDAVELLQNYHWNGNIRELQNQIEKAVILSENDVLQPKDFEINTVDFQDTTNTSINDASLEDAEEQVIRNAMLKYNGNLSLVAKALKISRPTLYNRLKKYGI